MPSQLLLLRRGDNPSSKGTFRVTDVTVRVFDSVMRQLGRDRVAVDFEHNTLKGTPAYEKSREPRPIAAKGRPVLTALGIELCDLEWTTTGKKMAEHFADLSPAVIHQDGIVMGVDSAGLVRNGAIYDLSFCSAAEIEMTALSVEENMDKLIVALKAAKLIPETAGEAEALAHLVALSSDMAALKGQLATLGTQFAALSADKLQELVGGVVGEKITPLSAAVDALKAEGIEKEKSHLLDLARLEGKVVALTSDVVSKLSIAELKEQIEKIAPTVPLEQRTRTTGLSAGGVTKTAPTEVQKSVASSLGLDAAKIDWK